MAVQSISSRFQVAGIIIHAAGEQPCVVDAHLTTRRYHTSTVISVAIGDLLVAAMTGSA